MLFAASLTPVFAAASWVGNSAVNVNGTWYYCGNNQMTWCTGGSFNDGNLGEISALYLGGQSQVADNGNDWQSGQVQMFYKIDELDVQTIYLDYDSYGHGEYSNNMRFQSGGSNFVDTPVDISTFAAGSTHTIAVWFYCDVYDNNGGPNYVATFTKKAPKAIASSDDIEINEDPVDVQINGLTLYKDKCWNTLCLPFSLTSTEIETSPLAGAEIRELSSSTLEGTTLTLNFSKVTAIEAGTPYIVKWTSKADPVKDPIFTGVILSTNGPGYKDGDYIFTGCFEDESIDGQDYLYLGADNTLYYPESSVQIGAFHAYFVSRDKPAEVKAFVLNFDDETTSIKTISESSKHSNNSNAYFTLDGRRLTSQPTSAGLYIVNGKKILIK